MSVSSSPGAMLRAVVLIISAPSYETAQHSATAASSAALLRRETEVVAADGFVRSNVSMASLISERSREASYSLAGTCCDRDRNAASSAETLGYLPKIPEFKRLWSGKMELDRLNPHWKDSVRKDLKILIGVMSFSDEDESRKIIRETWMNQPGVCNAAKGVQDNCAFYVVFVIGGNKTAKDSDSADVMRVEAEKPTIFKIKSFLHRSIEQFPWATHYGKMDSDTFPHVYKLLPRIPMPNRTCEVFFGATIPSHGCGLTYITEASKNAKVKFACMHGSLYIFSRQLALGMMKPGGTVDDWFSGKHGDITSEDLNFGIALTEHVRKANMCLNVTEAFMPDDPGGLWDHCGVNCKGVEGRGSFR